MTTRSSVAGEQEWSLATPLPDAKISIELFPPKNAEAELDLEAELRSLRGLRPSFFTVTCGAGGTDNDRTFEVVQAVRKAVEVPVAAHLTCVGRSIAEVDAQADHYWNEGVRHLIALRGDKPKDAARFEPVPGGYAYASDLVRGLMARHAFDISVAGYPETHPEAASADADLDNLARKVDAGAARVVGQYCFDLDAVLRFREAMTARGIGVPFVPGIMPIHNFRQVRNFSLRCGASVPEWLERLFDGVEPETPLHQMVAASVAAEQCRRLVAEGFDHLHIYALNRAELTVATARLLGRSDTPQLAA
ncbi:MAG: methylenetetrahydrofolate reductase [Geminicoccaceae bacterium]|nr:methylenetetrahydrofolate reductase [Geminicoccaceae bacterium]